MMWSADATRMYRRTFNIDTELARDSTIYIPYFARYLSIHLNDEMVHFNRPMVRWHGRMSFGSVLLELPSNLRVDGINRLRISVASESLTPGTLSPIYIGPPGTFDRFFQVRRFLSVDLKRITFGAQLLLGIVCLGIALVRRSEKSFAWLGFFLVASSGTFVGALSTTFPALEGLWPMMFLLATGGSLATVGFSYAFIGRAPPRALLPMAFLVPTTLIVLVWWAGLDVRIAGLFIAIPVHVFSIAVFVTVLLGDNASKYPKASRAIGYGGALLLLTMIHDVGLNLGLVDSGLFLAQSLRIPLFVAIGAYLTMRLVKSLEAGDRAAEVLRRKLAGREAELRGVLDTEKRLVKQLATQHERERITTDLHDGVAGHLSTIVALSEDPAADGDEIKRVARYALTDLHIIIHALDLHTGNLLSALAVLRERTLNPLINLGIEVEWSMLNLPPDLVLAPEKVLSVARIIQESVTNAVKHGNAQKISVMGSTLANGGVKLTVENSGGTLLSSGALTPNNGLRNMRLRARELGAEFTLVPTPTGACMTLSLALGEQ